MAADDQLSVLAFCWNTESLLFGKTPDGVEVTLTKEELAEVERIERVNAEEARLVEEMARDAAVQAGEIDNSWSAWYNYAWNATGTALSTTSSAISTAASYAASIAWASFKLLHGEPLRADFVEPLIQRIQETRPDILCINLIESAKPGEYLISHIFPQVFEPLGYTLQYRDRFIGVGATTIKVGIMRGIRLAIFIRNDHILSDGQEAGNGHLSHKDLFKTLSYACDNKYGKGGLGIVMRHPRFGNIGFVGMHLPHNAKSLIEYRNPGQKYRDRVYRHEHITKINNCFNGVVTNVVYNQEEPLNAVVMMGDFNYRIQTPSAFKFTQYMMSPDFRPAFVYENLDEYHLETIAGTIHPFIEGVDGQGPTFRPTCKMIKDRDVQSCSRSVNPPMGFNYEEDDASRTYPPKASTIRSRERGINDNSELAPEKCWNLGKYDQRTPSWCDRIVYQTFQVDGRQMLDVTCDYYDRYDYPGNMTRSDHAGVWASFTISRH